MQEEDEKKPHGLRQLNFSATSLRGLECSLARPALLQSPLPLRHVELGTDSCVNRATQFPLAPTAASPDFRDGGQQRWISVIGKCVVITYLLIGLILLVLRGFAAIG
jgi:hypothetical protein